MHTSEHILKPKLKNIQNIVNKRQMLQFPYADKLSEVKQRITMEIKIGLQDNKNISYQNL